ncbi:Large proline-rich protein BAG6 [Phytophthora nicotianae]|uniref:Large proline-rich protein BAG6 n=1 Tax=Phytophthora nicotianae TaxID=4792 RepID=A0A0W8CYA5_PHYNI|nr:Large proline-rich protein BAG6 [Phytophthora nicotianae]
MDAREEDELTIQIPPHDGSQTERTRGTFGGRQRWLSGNATDTKVALDSKAMESMVSPRRGLHKMKVSAPSVQPYLSSLGISVGDESQIVEKEVDEIAGLRRKLEEEVENMTMTLHGRMADNSQIKSQMANIENKSALYESKLEEEYKDRGVYNHMIQRLTREALDAKKATIAKEKTLQALQQELSSAMTGLLAARQEKSAAESAYKTLYTDWWEKKQANIRALDDLQHAVEQTRLKSDILEAREVSRKNNVQAALGQLKQKESRRLRRESSAQMTHFSEIQEELSDTDRKLMSVEAELKQIIEAAGTNDVDKIIAKYVGREDTLRALKEEHTISDARMRKLRDRHKQLNESLSHLRSAAANSRTIYQEMDQTSERLKETEKEAAVLADKCNRANVLMDAFRACMLKCLTKLSTVHGSLDYDDQHELSRAMETPTADLLHIMEQKLNRVLDFGFRLRTHWWRPTTDDKPGVHQSSVRAPASSETEEHFILRMASTTASPANVRVRPKSRSSVVRSSFLLLPPGEEPKVSSVRRAGHTTAHDGTYHNDEFEDSNAAPVDLADDETVIDRHMRKKLVGLIVNRGKRGKKSSTQPQTSPQH